MILGLIVLIILAVWGLGALAKGLDSVANGMESFDKAASESSKKPVADVTNVLILGAFAVAGVIFYFIWRGQP